MKINNWNSAYFYLPRDVMGEGLEAGGVSKNWRVSHKNDCVAVFLFQMVDVVMITRWLSITKIGTKEDEESGLLMGFWRSLSGQPVVQIAASRTLPVNSALHCILNRLGRQLEVAVQWSIW